MLFNSGKKQFLAGWRGVSLFYTHLQRGTRMVLIAVVLLLVLVIIYFLQGLFNKQKASADLAKFYPAKCLGGWQYTAHAENVPDLSPVASIDDFNDINSAVLDNAMAQLYCSNFNGENPIGTVPKKLTLRLSLGVKPKIVVEAPVESGSASPVMIEEPVVDGGTGSAPSETPASDTPVSSPAEQPAVDSPEPAPTETPATSPSEPVSEVPAAAPVEAPAPAPSPEPTSLVPRSFLDNLFAWFTIGTVRAQEAASPEVTVSPAPVEVAPESPVSPEIVPVLSGVEVPVLSEASVLSSVEGEVSIPVDDQASSTAETGSESPVTTTIEGVGLEAVGVTPGVTVMPSDALLEVSYTLDGQTWKSLGWVAESNWREASFDVPLEGISDWSNLDWLQVRFDRVVSIDANQPIFYLDGMWLEGEYDNLETEETEAELGIEQPDLKKDKILKQKIVDGFVTINTVRDEDDKQELWYRKAKEADYWKKVDVDNGLGYPILLDVRSNIIFFVSQREDKKMLVLYNLITTNTNMIDVVPGALSVATFDEVLKDGSGIESHNLYYIDDNDSYYFSK